MRDSVSVEDRDESPTIADEQASVVHAEGEERSAPSALPKQRRLLKRIGLTLLAIFAVLVVLALLAYNFGSMETPSAEVRAQYAALEAAGKVPPVREGFHIPIPGCRCHSSDPVLQMQHASIPIRECVRCHGQQAQTGPGTSGL